MNVGTLLTVRCPSHMSFVLGFRHFDDFDDYDFDAERDVILNNADVVLFLYATRSVFYTCLTGKGVAAIHSCYLRPLQTTPENT